MPLNWRCSGPAVGSPPRLRMNRAPGRGETGSSILFLIASDRTRAFSGAAGAGFSPHAWSSTGRSPKTKPADRRRFRRLIIVIPSQSSRATSHAEYPLRSPSKQESKHDKILSGEGGWAGGATRSASGYGDNSRAARRPHLHVPGAHGAGARSGTRTGSPPKAPRCGSGS
jgi:hypothetical protein